MAQQNLDILPRAFDVDEFARDVALEEKLAGLSASFSKQAELLDDTLLAVASDAYVAALTVYQCARIAGKGRVWTANWTRWANDLRARCNRRRRNLLPPNNRIESFVTAYPTR